MKKKLIFLSCLLLATTLLMAKPGEKLLRSFNQSFPLAENVKWHEDAAGYLVSFTQLGIITKVSYDKSGTYLNSLRYYDESKLPLNILLAVKKKFSGKTIFGVTEFSNEEEVTYHIKLQDEKNWYTVKATSDASLMIEERLKKEASNN